MPVIRLLSFATVMLAAASVAAEKDHIEVVKELVKLADKIDVNKQQKEKSETNRDEWLSKVNQSSEKTKTLNSTFDRLTKEKATADGQLAVFTADKSTWGTELIQRTKELNDISVTEKDAKEAQAAAFNLGEENQRLTKLTAKADVTRQIYSEEIALKEMAQKKVVELKLVLKKLVDEAKLNLASASTLSDAQALAYKNMVSLQTKETEITNAMAANKQQTDALEAEQKKQEQKCKETAEDKLTVEKEKLTDTQIQKQTEEQYIKNLRTKVDLWKSMTNFLQKDLEKYKFESAQTKILYNQEKARKVVKQQEEKKNTEEELVQLNGQIEEIQKNAISNKSDADELMKSQALQAKLATKEAAKLRKEISSLENLHNLTKAQMILAQNQSIRAQQLADAKSKGRMMVLIEGLKLQRSKANEAIGKVQVLKAALTKYEAVSQQIGLTTVETTSQSYQGLSVTALPSIDLSENTAMTQFHAYNHGPEEPASYEQQEQEELKAIEDRFNQQAEELVASFQSESSVNDIASKASAKIEADRQRIISFMQTILSSYNKVQAAFKQGMLTQRQMNEKTREAKERMAFARKRYASFKRQTAVTADSSVQRNQDIRQKLSDLMSQKEAAKMMVREKYESMRDAL